MISLLFIIIFKICSNMSFIYVKIRLSFLLVNNSIIIKCLFSINYDNNRTYEINILESFSKTYKTIKSIKFSLNKVHI